MRKYTLVAWKLVFALVFLIFCYNAFNLYSISMDRVTYSSELRQIDNPYAKAPIVLSALSDHILEVLEPNKTNEMNKNVSELSPDTYAALEFNIKAVYELIEELDSDGLFDKVRMALEKETRKIEEKRKDILDKLRNLDEKFSASLTIVVACVGFSSFLIAALNLILKYNRSFSYIVVSSDNSNEGTEKSLVLINNHDKAETILSVSFVASRKLYKLKLDLHSYMTPPLPLAAFGHLNIPISKVAIQQMNNHSDSCKLLIRTGDDAVSKAVNISRIKAEKTTVRI